MLGGHQNLYLSFYREADTPQRQLKAQNIFYSSFPRYAFEGLGMIVIALIGVLLSISSGEASSGAIPLLGALALGAQRLLPALQQIYNGWSRLMSDQSAIQEIVSLVDKPMPRMNTLSYPLPLDQGY